jgi:hypothetical protein
MGMEFWLGTIWKYIGGRSFVNIFTSPLRDIKAGRILAWRLQPF